MGINIKPQNLTDAIMHELRQYNENVDEIVADAVDKTARKTASRLKRTSPKLTGDYQKGWRVRLVTEKKGRYVKEVHNATDYQLTYLLEKGHAKPGGGMVDARVHIEPAEQEANEELVRMIKEALE